MFGATVNKLYSHIAFGINNASDDVLLGDLDDLVNKALKNIYSGFDGLEPHLVEITDRVLKEAITDSVKLAYNADNAAFIHELKYNVGVFAAFKAHKEGKAMAALLYDENGKLVSESQFRKEALKISDHNNKVWLRTERNTALRRGRMASKFKKFADDSALYPNLRWLPTTSGNPDEIHQSYYYMVRPVGDPFWINNFPGNRWNCQCDIEQTKDPVTALPKVTEEAPDGLDGNPAFTKQIISSSHPVFKGLSKSERKQLKAEMEQLKETTPYPDSPNFSYKNGSQIFIHPYAHKKDLKSNLENAIVVAKSLPNLDFRIRVHLEIPGKANPEYEINGKLADLKLQTGKNINGIKSAIAQGCEVILFQLTTEYPYSIARFLSDLKSELLKRKNNVSQVIIIKDGKVTQHDME